MSSDAFAGTDNSDLSEVDPVVGSDNLSALLKDEHFLVKVLTCVLDDGLHECRLVCRRWRDACGKLPVDLQANGIPPDKLSRAVDLFPEAKTLSISEVTRSADVVETHLIPHLQRLKNLNHFSLFLLDPIDLRNVIACFSSMQHLRSLQLRIDHEDSVHCFIHDLRYLKNLTSLFLIHTCHLQKDLDPVDYVHGLSQLEIDMDLLINRKDEPVFPMLTGLTSLVISDGGTRHLQQLPYNLQSIVPYAAKLQSFIIRMAFEESSTTESSPWRSFLHLSSLTINCFSRRDTIFFQALKQMHRLRSLNFAIMSEKNEQEFAETMPSLTGLRSLTLLKYMFHHPISTKITEHLTVLAQLTELYLYDAIGSHSLRFPKGIVNLDLQCQKTFPEDPSEELVHLTNLASLNINAGETELLHLFRSDGVTPLHVFKELGQLKTLSLHNVCLDCPFLDAFVALTGLTALRLDGWPVQVDHKLFCQQLRFLSNLKVLKVPFPLNLLVDREAGVPRGCLSKIRRIEGSFTQGTMDGNTYAALVKAFPCLRSVKHFPVFEV